jgi:predicted Zn-dependent protease
MEQKHMGINRRQLLHWAGLGVSAAVAQQVLVSCAVNPVTGQSQLMMVSENQELGIDKQQSPQQFSTDYGVVPDARLNAYLSRVGREVAARSHRPQIPFSFRAVNAAYVNAYAFPGGSIAATRGILAEMETEAELAALFGHEIGHVSARHTAQQASKGMLTNLVLSGISVATSAAGLGSSADLIQGLGGLGAGALLASYSRDNERQADALGMEYMTAAGYSPQGMVDLMDMLRQTSKRQPGALDLMFSTHPMSDERFASAQQAVATTYRDRTQQAVNRERYMDETASVRRIKPMLTSLQQASEAAGKKQYPQAEQLFKQALKQGPGDYTALLMMAKFQMGTDNGQAAESYGREAMRAYPGEPQASLVTGFAALGNKRYESAYQLLGQYDQLMPGRSQIVFYQGYCLEQMGRQQEAAQKYRAYLQRQQQGKEAQYAYNRLKSWGYLR